MEDIILIGGGGHCKSVIDTLKEIDKFNIIGILDLKDKVGTNISGIEIIGTDDDMEDFFKKGIKYGFLTVGSIGDVSLRRRTYLRAKKIGYIFPNIIDRTSIISKDINIGYGNYIGKGTIINTNSTIKNNCIINTGAIIEHDCYIEDFSHIAPGTTMSGNVSIGENTHIGTNTTIIQNIKIGDNTIIGAGSVVVKDISQNKIAYGNPCKEVK